MALVKELVDLHHGIVSVNSLEGKGSVFMVRLPLVEMKPEEEIKEISVLENDFSLKLVSDYEINEIEESISESVSPLNDNREIVLIVEDNRDVRAYIRELLEEDYRIKEAENGEEGILVALEIMPDLIGSDLMMPRLNGFQFCKEIRNNERTSHIPIIMLTAKTGYDDKMEGLEIGVDDYITKPFSAKELKARVANLIKLSKLLRSQF